MSWHQTTVKLKARKAGCHLITEDIIAAVPEIKSVSQGLMLQQLTEPGLLSQAILGWSGSHLLAAHVSSPDLE